MLHFLLNVHVARRPVWVRVFEMSFSGSRARARVCVCVCVCVSVCVCVCVSALREQLAFKALEEAISWLKTEGQGMYCVCACLHVFVSLIYILMYAYLCACTMLNSAIFFNAIRAPLQSPSLTRPTPPRSDGLEWRRSVHRYCTVDELAALLTSIPPLYHARDCLRALLIVNTVCETCSGPFRHDHRSVLEIS